MIVGNVSDLTIETILHRGVPNRECVVIWAIIAAQLGQYGLMLGNVVGGQRAFPYTHNLFWFGDGYVRQNDWLFVYTGSGNSTKSTVTGDSDMYSVYWGRPTTLFAQSHVVLILFRVDAVDILMPPMDKLQIVTPPSQ